VKDQSLTAIHVTHDQEEALMMADRIVVLRNGRIEQIGTPPEVYSRPQSIFVASFVGGANFIEGTVVKSDDTGSFIEVVGGRQIQVAESGLEAGEKAVLAFRLEDTVVGEAEVAGFNNLSGVVEAATFIGGSMEYRIRLENGGQIASKILISDAFKAYKPGDQVVASFPPEKGYVFPYPVMGLLKEIEAI
jgi:ABC-type Fe3+/spermidine/putrescine transport system ATPase subunit